jgi:hypothetical protein
MVLAKETAGYYHCRGWSMVGGRWLMRLVVCCRLSWLFLHAVRYKSDGGKGKGREEGKRGKKERKRRGKREAKKHVCGRQEYNNNELLV